MKKFLSVALAAVMMLSLAACGSSSNKAESSSEGGSASDKTYIIATDTTFAPFEFTNDKNEFVGIDVDILAAIAKDQGFKYSATMYQDVKTGNTVACFEDQPVMAYGVSQGNGLEIVAEEKDNFSTPYGFAVLKGQNADLLKMFNEGLKNIKANGTYDEIVAKYTSAK